MLLKYDYQILLINYTNICLCPVKLSVQYHYYKLL